MGRVLAIEPEASKAEALREIVRDDVGAEFVLVTSAYAAVVAINRQIPDLVLFSGSISDRHRERVVDHLKSVSRIGAPPTLSIPALRNGDRAAFVSQIGTSLERQSKRQVPPPSTAPALPLIPPPSTLDPAPPVDPEPASEHESVPEAIDPVELELLSQASALETASVEGDTDELGADDDWGVSAAAESGAASLTAAVDSMLEGLTVDPMTIEISTYPGLVEPPEETGQIDETDEAGEDHDGELDIPIEDFARSRRPGGYDSEPDDTVDLEIHTAEIALVQAQADAKMAAEVERVRAEAAAQREAELARSEAEAAAQREAAAKMAAEVERLRAEAAQQRAADMARVEAEAAAQREAVAKMAAELERVRTEAAEQRAAELARIEAEAAAQRETAVAQARL